MVKQKYEHCRILLTYFDQHFHHHVKLELMEVPNWNCCRYTCYNFTSPILLDPMVMNKPVTPNETVTTAKITPVTQVNSRGFKSTC
jgi:hypothetical protein